MINNNIILFSIMGLGVFVSSGLFLFLERKSIAFGQKRLGITFLGRAGWIHLIADLFKFWIKKIGRGKSFGHRNNLLLLSPMLAMGLFFVIFVLASSGRALLDIDFTLLLYLLLAAVNNILFFTIITTARSKYSSLSAARVAMLTFFLEVPFMACFLVLMYLIGDVNFDSVNYLDSPFLIIVLPLSVIFLIYALVEGRRAPFDHTEAESELVAGHLNEFGGRSLLVFFICEYLHGYFLIFLIWVLPLNSFNLLLFLSYALTV